MSDFDAEEAPAAQVASAPLSGVVPDSGVAGDIDAAASELAAGLAGAPGELGALAYHLYDTNPELTEEEAFEAFTDWVASRGIELWPHQEEALMSLMVGDHVVLGTPTGSGKSLVALGMHFMAMCFGETSYYTAPIKALVSEKFFQLVKLLGRENVGMVTGDVHINTTAPVICCTQEILANLALREGPDTPVHSVACDEFHFFADSDRGWAWQVPLLILPHTQFLLMSATLGDVSDIAGLLKRQTDRDVSLVVDAPRPVPLAYEYSLTPLEGTVELALRAGEGPLYIVHFSQDAAITSAQSLASYGVASKAEREAVKEAMKGAQFNTAFGKTLKRLLGCGVGVHHAGMLPRYRLLVEKLAQQGLLPVICGTDTLGVGINVPIHTVVLTQLTKFDGRKMRRLRSREFHQVAGRAGRSGFDTEGMVIAEAPEHDIENHKAEVKAAGDPKKLKKIKKKRPPEGFVNWNENTFTTLVDSTPEKLTPRLRITHSMMLAEVEQGGNAKARVDDLIEASLQPDAEKAAHHVRAAEVLQTLIDADVVERYVDDAGEDAYRVTDNLPDDFALDQPLSPFLLASLELLDPESPTYALDVISMVEATLEDPRQILRAQERKARDAAMAEMKMDGIEYEERLERLAEVTYEKPLAELLDRAFRTYCEAVPWARDYCLRPKSILRDMIECAADFKGYIQKLGIMRYEGILLRYLSEAFRSLSRTVPEGSATSSEDFIAWLGVVVRSVDSSLIDEWESAGASLDEAPPSADAADVVVKDRRGLEVLVRNALFSRVRYAAHRDVAALGELDGEWGFGERAWAQVLDAYFEAHEEILLDADARSKAYLILNSADEDEAHVWHVRQIFHDGEGDNDFAIAADVDLDATQSGDSVVFRAYHVGFIEDIINDLR